VSVAKTAKKNQEEEGVKVVIVTSYRLRDIAKKNYTCTHFICRPETSSYINACAKRRKQIISQLPLLVQASVKGEK
jgi:hypothetical protein